MRIAGARALVTGASRRVGRVIALALAGEGADVAVHFRSSQAEAEETAKAITALGVKAMTVRADLTVERDVAEMVDKVGDGIGGPDILVNNASVYFKTPIATVNEDEWDRTVDGNLKSAFLASVHCGRRMSSGSGGVIVSISDSAVLNPYRDYIPYCVAKSGIVAMTEGLARALAPGVRVNAIAPGPIVIATDLSEEEAEKIRERVPLKRHCTPEDVARAVVFLVESGDYITGTVMQLDGGRSLQ